MMLAQFESVAPSVLRDFALIIGGLAATAYYVKALFWGEGKIPQPLRTTREDKFVSEKDCASRHKDETNKITQLHQQLIAMEASRETQRQLASEDRKSIYSHIDHVRRELSDKIEAMPSRIIADLRNAKGLLD